MPRLTSAAIAALVALTLSACSPDGGDASGTTTTTTTTQAGGGGDFDCAVLDDPETQTYLLGIQILAQLRSQDQVDGIKSGSLTYDPDGVKRVLELLKGLPSDGTLGDPGPDLDFYLEANEKARAILAVDGPVPQEMFDDLIAFEGDIGSFLGHQLSINGAVGEACE